MTAEQQISNLDNLNKLKDSDWKVLRHIREKALGIPTSLSDSEYALLEAQRQEFATSIVRN